MFAFCFGFIVATLVGVFVPRVPVSMLVAGDWVRDKWDRFQAWRASR
ncbi:hypothetical protein [Methylibium petroleiphilum]